MLAYIETANEIVRRIISLRLQTLLIILQLLGRSTSATSLGFCVLLSIALCLARLSLLVLAHAQGSPVYAENKNMRGRDGFSQSTFSVFQCFFYVQKPQEFQSCEGVLFYDCDVYMYVFFLSLYSTLSQKKGNMSTENTLSNILTCYAKPNVSGRTQPIPTSHAQQT